MLHDIGKHEPIDQTIGNARQMTMFLYAHTRVLDLMKNFLGKTWFVLGSLGLLLVT